MLMLYAAGARVHTHARRLLLFVFFSLFFPLDIFSSLFFCFSYCSIAYLPFRFFRPGDPGSFLPLSGGNHNRGSNESQVIINASLPRRRDYTFSKRRVLPPRLFFNVTIFALSRERESKLFSPYALLFPRVVTFFHICAFTRMFFHRENLNSK